MPLDPKPDDKTPKPVDVSKLVDSISEEKTILIPEEDLLDIPDFLKRETQDAESESTT